MLAPGEVSVRQAYFLEPEDRAIVLGSTEPVSDVDLGACAEAGCAVLRRGSGGGSVVLGPGGQVWLDLFVPAADALTEVDVAAAAHFAGEVWHDALSLLVPGGSKLSVYSGPLIKSRYSSKVCFSGLGPGEVLLNGQKAVGVSQRRNRQGAWFFTMAMLGLDPGLHARLLEFDDPGERARLEAALLSSVTVLPFGADKVKDALVSCLS